MVLDETATAERSAEERLFLPTTQPEPDRWLNLALVVEASTTMAVWYSLVEEFIALLQRSGAFRDIRLWYLHPTPDGGAGLHPQATVTLALHSPREILDPTGRQVVWLMSDCVSPLWSDGRTAEILERWGHSGPLAIIQPLPQRLWHRTALRPQQVRLHTATPAAPNSRLRLTHPEHPPRGKPATDIPVPVLELEPSWLASWARLITASAPGGVPTIVTSTAKPTEPAGDVAAATRPPSGSSPELPDQPQDPLSLVRGFRSHASPQAYRLAGCLAAVPLTLPVMRLVQHVMLPTSRPAHLAEVLLSGLLKRTSPDTAPPEYDFIDGVRDVLRSTIRRSDTHRVYDEVSAYLAAHAGSTRDTSALAVLPSGRGSLTLTDPSHPYAQITMRGEPPQTLADSPRTSLHDDRTPSPPRAGDGREPGPRIGPQPWEGGHQEPTAKPPVGAASGPGSAPDDQPQAPTPADGRGGTWQEVLHTGNALSAAGGTVISGFHDSSVTLPPEALRPPSEVDAPPGLDDLPYQPAPFVGRAHELHRLDVAPSASEVALVQVVHGLGGIGKSALALDWASTRTHGHYPVRWINADSPAGIQQGLADLATALQPALKMLPAEARAEYGVQWLASHNGWLLILDNVNHPTDIAPLISHTTGGGRFLITSRLANLWPDTATLIRLNILDEAESLELLTRIITAVGPRDLDDAADLCTELGHLPLAIQQAAAYIAQHPLTTPRAYLRLLTEHPAAMYRQAAATTPAERTIARIWTITFDRLANQSPLSVQLLRLLAWYASDNIPVTLLEGLAGPREQADAIQLLLASSMISGDSNTLSVHRLVQALLRTPEAADPHRQPDDVAHARQQAISQLHQAFFAESQRSATRLRRRRYLLPHVKALSQHWHPEQDTVDLAYLLSATATYAQERGALTVAIIYNRRALATFERILGADHRDTVDARNNLAAAYQESGDFDRANALYEPTLADRVRVLGEDHPFTLSSRNNLAYASASAEHPGPSEHAFVVCYAPTDSTYGRSLASQLRTAGLPVWSVADLRPGDAHFWTIRQQLRYALAVVVVMTPSSQDSDDITRMILEGQVHGRTFVPVLLDGEVNYHLASTWHLDARDGQLLDEAELDLLRRLCDDMQQGRPERLPGAPPTAPAPVARLTAPAWLEQLRKHLAEDEYEHADLITTRLLLEAADRLPEGWLGPRHAAAVPSSLLADVDALWRARSSGRQGFGRQLALIPDGGRRGPRFPEIGMALGWRDTAQAAVPRLYRDFVRRAGPGRRPGFFPTLRDPGREDQPDWYDRWSSTVLAVHTRVREAEHRS